SPATTWWSPSTSQPSWTAFRSGSASDSSGSPDVRAAVGSIGRGRTTIACATSYEPYAPLRFRAEAAVQRGCYCAATDRLARGVGRVLATGEGSFRKRLASVTNGSQSTSLALPAWTNGSAASGPATAPSATAAPVRTT